jgi:hypothetical protein
MHRVAIDTHGWLHPQPNTETVSLQLVYDNADPLAVTVRLTGHPANASWTFGRDLLADGLRSKEPIGAGVVRVHATAVLVHIDIDRPDGTTLNLRMPWWTTREFMRLAYREIERGQESVDVDALLAEIMSVDEG